jgi:hypothetical protein
MDPAALATALVAAKTGELQMAFAAKMMKMNAQNAASIVQVLEAGQENIKSLVAAGVGQNLDISV